MQNYYKKYAAVFLLPLLACFIVAFIIPFFMGLFFSMTKYVAVNNWEWRGFDNYSYIFDAWTDLSKWRETTQQYQEQGIDVVVPPLYSTTSSPYIPTFIISLGRTTLFAAVCIVTINFNAFLLALLLTKGLKGSNTYRSIFFMPNLIGGIVLGYIWRIILNGILLKMGQNLTSSPWFGFFGLVILMNWQQVGYMMLIYIAALMNVPTDLNESAEIDGAGKFQTTLHITIPMIVPAFTICSFLTLANSYKLFDQNIALSGNSISTNLLAADIVNTTVLKGGNLGPQQAKSVLFFLIVALISGIQVFATRRKEQEA